MFRRTPGEGSPHFDRFDGQNFTFPALWEGTGISLSADSDSGLLALRTIGCFLFKEAPLSSFDEYEISTKSKIREITEKQREEFCIDFAVSSIKDYLTITAFAETP